MGAFQSSAVLALAVAGVVLGAVPLAAQSAPEKVPVTGGKVEAPAKPVRHGVPGGAPVPPALVAPVPVMTGPLNQVTLTWLPVAASAGETIGYVVRKATVDPATTTAAPGYVTGAPSGAAGGPITLVDRNAALDTPTWYKVVATSSTRGSAEGAWARRDPPLHRSLDTLTGGYWREVVPQGSRSLVRWIGCIRYSPVPGAGMYGARVRVGTGAWITLPRGPVGQSGPGVPQGVPSFSTDNPAYAAMLPPLEHGGVPRFQAWPMYPTTANGSGPFVADTAHLASTVYRFAQIAPLNPMTCTP